MVVTVQPLPNFGLLLSELEVERDRASTRNGVQQERTAVFQCFAFLVLSEVDGGRHSMDHPDARLNHAILHVGESG